ncbi:MAG TPA: hypothetical protein VFV30_08315 [Novosphingobium sp.]|nr:hypothetical protein [Novosphingobium sp.]
MADDDILHRPMVLDEFLPLVGRQFLANCDPAEVELTLVEASPLKDRGVTDRPPFILVFHTPPEAMLVEGSYVMRCGGWGPDRISIWPTMPPRPAEPGYYYQAVFN